MGWCGCEIHDLELQNNDAQLNEQIIQTCTENSEMEAKNDFGTRIEIE
jgi:hypothetical protein